MFSCPWMSRRVIPKLAVEGWMEQPHVPKHWEERGKEDFPSLCIMDGKWPGASRRVISPGQGKQHRCDSIPVMHCTLVTEWNVICVFLFRDYRQQLAPRGRAALKWGTEKDAYVKWPGNSAQEGQAHSFSTVCSNERDYCWGGRQAGTGGEKLGVQMSTLYIEFPRVSEIK